MVNLPYFDMVIGQYTSHVSEGNRVTFPKKFSKEEGNSWLMTKGLDENLIMLSSSQKALLLEGIETKPYIRQKKRQQQAFVLGNTFVIELDQANRFVIPLPLFLYSGITKEVIFAGIGNFVQVWDRSRWEDYQKSSQSTVVKEFEQEEE